jgi:hypothetical protein
VVAIPVIPKPHGVEGEKAEWNGRNDKREILEKDENVEERKLRQKERSQEAEI